VVLNTKIYPQISPERNPEELLKHTAKAPRECGSSLWEFSPVRRAQRRIHHPIRADLGGDLPIDLGKELGWSGNRKRISCPQTLHALAHALGLRNVNTKVNREGGLRKKPQFFTGIAMPLTLGAHFLIAIRLRDGWVKVVPY